MATLPMQVDIESIVGMLVQDKAPKVQEWRDEVLGYFAPEDIDRVSPVVNRKIGEWCAAVAKRHA